MLDDHQPDLTDRQKMILLMSYAPGEHKAYKDEEIASHLHLSRMQIHRDRKKALATIKAHVEKHGVVDLGFIFGDDAANRDCSRPLMVNGLIFATSSRPKIGANVTKRTPRGM